MTTPETQPVASTPGRRLFQYSIAELLTLTTIIAVILSVLKWSDWRWPFVAAIGFVVLSLTRLLLACVFPAVRGHW